MNNLIPNPAPLSRRRPEHWLASTLATGLIHGVAVLMLWHSWSPQAPPSAPQTVMITQLVTLPSPTPEPEPEPVPEPAPEPEPVVEAQPKPPEPQIDQGEIARKRLEQQQQRVQEEQQRLAQRRLEQQRQQEREQLARHEQQERELTEQRAREQQRLAAEARALADADAARRAAEQAAIAQYQPISKKPPAYPRRALDSGKEGDCTVTYTVTREGRVKNPQVVDGACDDPMFERPSLNAANSFHYQPRLINGQPVEVSGIRNTFRDRIQ